MNIVHLAQKILEMTYENGGFTVDHNGNIPARGYVVAYKNYETKFAQSTNVLHDLITVIEYIDTYRWLLTKHENYFIGSWIDGGVIYLDLCMVLTNHSKQQALSIGKREGQKAIYDLDKQETINC